jgi:ABC-type multidrug transport system fused ATPase/permease subunit
MMSTLLFSPIMEVSNVARNLGNVTGAADRIQRVLDETEEVVDDGPDVDMVSLGTPRIVFDDVSFSYDESTAPALKGVSFTVEPGETVALVGPSGAGKTTCSSLLLRTWDVDSGSISVAGRDIREMSLDSLHTLLSAVLQDSYLFNMPVRENIRLGRLDASDDEVEAAAKTAHIHDFIESLPAGYDTMTGERGSQLSGGQRQRISIARAVLKNAPILILDEAVSNLDTENERAIQKALDEQLAGRTSLVIAHRLSTILSADRIVVLNAGRVEADGTHAELLATSEFYRKLIELQLAKEQEDAEE